MEVLLEYIINIKIREDLVFLLIGLIYYRRNIKYNIIRIFIKLGIRIKRVIWEIGGLVYLKAGILVIIKEEGAVEVLEILIVTF